MRRLVLARARRALGEAAILFAVVGSINACAEKTFAPGAAGSGLVRLRILADIARQLIPVTRTIDIVVGYTRSGGEFVRILEQTTSATAGDSVQLALAVDVSSCIADPNRGAATNVCPLEVLVRLKDATGATLDSTTAGPVSAKPGVALEPLTMTVTVPVATVTVTSSAASVAVGGTVQLTATPRDADGNALAGRPVTWASRNPSVAVVSPAGLVTAVLYGIDTITATAEGKSGTAVVTATLSFVSFSLGRDHSCALTGGGALYCWGLNQSGQVGIGNPADTAFVPRPVIGGTIFAQTTSGDQHGCALTSTGAAFCWGRNGNGQLGTGDSLNKALPAAVAGGLAFASLAAGGTHSCGLTTVGSAYCWGYGFDTTTSANIPLNHFTPAAVSGGLSFTQVTSGEQHSCGLTATGVAYCWGINGSGQLGIGVLGNPVGVVGLTPVPVVGGLFFAKVTAGSFHSCGLTKAGIAYCWGVNSAGQLGNGTTTRALAPTAVSGGLTFTDINAGGGATTCGLTVSGVAYCWGDNTAGEIGDGTTANRSTPTPVTGGILFSQVSPGRFWHSCGMSTSATLYCWGYNAWGQLGNGGHAAGNQNDHDSHVPAKVTGQP